MRIYLIGMPASGKSTIGKELAKAKKYKFIDLDKKIEKDNKMEIKDIFSSFGEDKFRELETKALKETLDIDNVIISCGGGIVTKDINKKFMSGVVIYIEASLDELEFRLSRDNSTTRPLMSKNSVEELFNKRKDMYEAFKDIKVKSQMISKTVSVILKELKCYEKNLNN